MTTRTDEDAETKEILARLHGHVNFVSHREGDQEAVKLLEPEETLPTATPEALREELSELQKEKDTVLQRLSEAMDVLNASPVGMEKPLRDANGFPRADCDLYAVRQSRQTVICSRNDLVHLQNRMMEKLNQLHTLTRAEGIEQMVADAPLRAQREREAAERRERQNERERMAQLKPFLSIENVERHSPAHDAGLRAGQVVLRFGDLDSGNFEAKGGAAAMAAIVNANEGKGISVWVRTRGGVGSTVETGEISQHFVVPMEWEGRGKLGCGLTNYP